MLYIRAFGYTAFSLFCADFWAKHINAGAALAFFSLIGYNRSILV